ncbi:hypothetical protein K9M42_02795 [Patescibacteria group bacterium]|nr:hypothetical protein [Patescibacteria group bacterium]
MRIIKTEIISIAPVIENFHNLYGNYRIPILERDYFNDGTYQDINRGKYFYTKQKAQEWLDNHRFLIRKETNIHK